MIYIAFLIILLAVIVAAVLHWHEDPKVRPAALIALLGGGALAVILAIIGGTVTVSTGHVGVVTLWGKVQPGPGLSAGVHLISPFANVTEMNVQTRNYTMSAVSQEGQKAGDDSIKALSSDHLNQGEHMGLYCGPNNIEQKDFLIKHGRPVTAEEVLAWDFLGADELPVAHIGKSPTRDFESSMVVASLGDARRAASDDREITFYAVPVSVLCNTELGRVDPEKLRAYRPHYIDGVLYDNV